MQQALDQLCNQAAVEAKKGILILVLSDSNIQKNRIPIPSLLATAAVHYHLIKQRQRGKLGIVVQTGEARETHHFALLLENTTGGCKEKGTLTTPQLYIFYSRRLGKTTMPFLRNLQPK